MRSVVRLPRDELHEETREGKFVADTTFDQIKPGKTSAAWVKATLGEPSQRTCI